MHRGTKRTSYIPFLLNPETRLDVIPVRLHFCETIPQARQPISHRKVCVNNGMVSITHFKVSHGDIISFQENDARTRGEKIRRYFYIEISVKKILKIGYGSHPNLRRTFRFLRSSMQEEEVPRGRARRSRATTRERIPHRQGDRRRPSQGTSRPMQEEDLERVLQQLRSSMQEEDLERAKKLGSKKVCLGSSFAEHNRIKRNLYHFKSLFLSKRRNEKNRNIPTRTVSPIVDNFVFYRSTYCSAASPRQKTMKRKIKRIELPTHYSEVNHRTLKAVVSYGPNIGHIPHDIRLKDLNLLLRSGNGRGQNI